MKFASPETLAEAAILLREDGARCLSGGQSFVAMMNADLVSPSTLVSLRRIDGLARIEIRADGGLSIGAMATHAAVARLKPTSAGSELVIAAAGTIGHPAIRNQGTIGGSIAHADPAADYPTAITCAGATVLVVGANGERRIPAVEFFKGFYETALEPGEIVVAVDVPPGAAGAHAHYEKFALIDGDFAITSVAAIIGMQAGRCSFARLAVGACAATPVRDPAAEERLLGTTLDDDALDNAAGLLVQRCDPVDDFRGSAAYRLKLVPRLIKRAVGEAKRKAEQGHV
jgi:carbon-monoxide dehydrogenase medium subunit